MLKKLRNLFKPKAIMQSNPNQLYVIGFNKGIEIQFEEYLGTKYDQPQMKVFKGAGKLTEFNNSDYLFLLWADGTCTLLDKSYVKAINVDKVQ